MNCNTQLEPGWPGQRRMGPETKPGCLYRCSPVKCQVTAGQHPLHTSGYAPAIPSFPCSTLLQPSRVPVPVPSIMPAAQEQLQKVLGIYHPWQELLSIINPTFPLPSCRAFPLSLLSLLLLLYLRSLMPHALLCHK